MTPDQHWHLWHADPRATPFQSPAWLARWWEHLGGGVRLDAILHDAGGQIVGALPLFVWNDGGTRKLVPVGAGHSDYCDALIAPGARTDTLWQAILAHSDKWDEIFLPDLRADSALLSEPPDGWIVEDRPAEVCPVLSLPKNGPVLQALTRSQRRKIVHDRHRAARLGSVTEHICSARELDDALDALFSLHAARWAAANEPGVLADPRVQAFHRAVVPDLQEAGILRVVTVRHEARIVAVLYGFATATRWYSYINGVDMTVPGQSFGTLAFGTLIDAAAQAGAGEFHFLRGEEAYKYGWGASPTHTVHRTIRRR